MKKRKASPRRSGAKKAAAPVKMRIIGGSMGGRVLSYHGDPFTRPMKDNVRENLFNLIGPAIKSTQAVDLFAGTGALVFESLSRGASSAVAVEQNRIAVDWIHRNAEQLDVQARLRIRRGDCFFVGPQVFESVVQDTPRVVFFCPPYEMWESRAEELAKLVGLACQTSPPGSLVIVESDTKLDPPKGLPGIPWDERVYGRVRLQLGRPADHCGLTF